MGRMAVVGRPAAAENHRQREATTGRRRRRALVPGRMGRRAACARRGHRSGRRVPSTPGDAVSPDPTAEFAALAAAGGQPLDRAALLIAAHPHPGLDLDHWLGELDRLAGACPAATVEGLRRALYVDGGFAGNVVDYADPANSFLDDVLTRRTGIPISLAVVAMEVGRRAGVPLVGVGMPGHFLLRHRDDESLFVDPFDGVVLDPAGCRALFRRVLGPDATWSPSHLDPVGPTAILARMLANLKAGYAARGDAHQLAWVIRLRLLIPGVRPAERAELAQALASGGGYREAAAELEALAQQAPDQADALHRRAVGLRARLN
jgi:regulator of sirC expression with transglutaminase-like and TPR domain